VAAASDPVVCDRQVEDKTAVPCSVLEMLLISTSLRRWPALAVTWC